MFALADAAGARTLGYTGWGRSCPGARWTSRSFGVAGLSVIAVTAACGIACFKGYASRLALI